MSVADHILLIGLNPASIREAEKLRSVGNQVIYIGNSKRSGRISLHGKMYNLFKKEEIETLVKQFGLSDVQANKLLDVLQRQQNDSKDEIARLAAVWAQAERGGRVPGRLVLSGHSVGGIFWGDGNGMISLEDVQQLASIFKKASDQVQDLHISACYSGSMEMMDRWRSVFPNVYTIWAYSGSAPGTDVGAIEHMRIWSRATRGEKQALDRMIVSKTRKGENVAVWSRLYGYQQRVGDSINTLRARVTNGESIFRSFFSGDQTVTDTQQGPLREYYNDVQALLQHPELPAGERPRVESKRNTTIRLIYYEKSVKKNFTKNHAGSISAGYQALALAPPDYAALQRKQALGRIEQYGDLVATAKSPSQEAKKLLDLLQKGLRDLDVKYVPENWV